MSGWWEQLLAGSADLSARRLAWRVMRQFADPAELAEQLGAEPEWLWTVAQESQSSSADAVKLLLQTRPQLTGQLPQTPGADLRCEAVVLMPPGPKNKPAVAESPRSRRKLQRATACISSQPGCGVGCPFCLTASLGYRGNLSANQIVEQVYWAGVVARQYGRRLRNVVFMGMGEPLHNPAAVMQSLEWLISQRGFGLSPRHITVSTAGVPGAMVELARRFPQVRMALSLHSADPQQRRELVPRACGAIDVLRNTIAQVNAYQIQPVWIEIVLFNQLNDSWEHAQQIIAFCRQLRVEVNLIPYNTAGNRQKFMACPRERCEVFAQVLRAAGIRTSIRTSLGASAQAACGQLSAEAIAPLAQV